MDMEKKVQSTTSRKGRVGILTYHCVPNFGAQLQTLSSVMYFRNHGYEPIVINWYPDDLEAMYSTRVPPQQISAHNDFSSKYFPLTKTCRKEEDIVDIVEEYHIQAIFQGSDALFKYQPERLRRAFSKRKLKYIVRPASISVEDYYGNPFFGRYLSLLKPEIPAVIYAVSCQNCPYFLLTRNEKRRFRINLKRYRYLSVRDEWTKSMVESILGTKPVTLAPDPVFSFNANCASLIPSKSEILTRYHLQDNYVLISFWTSNISNDYCKKLNSTLKSQGLFPVAFAMPEGVRNFGIKNAIDVPLSPIDWYALIKYSKGYIGERMHPIVVAIHNSVPFFAFDEYGVYGKHGDFIFESSKTFVLVQQAGLYANYYSYNSNQELPESSSVVDSLRNFDQSICQEFSDKQYEQYRRNLNVVESLLFR